MICLALDFSHFLDMDLLGGIGSLCCLIPSTAFKIGYMIIVCQLHSNASPNLLGQSLAVSP